MKKIWAGIPFMVLVPYGMLLFFIYLMWLITAQYIPVDTNAAFLKTKQDEVVHLHYRIAFFCHVYTSIVALLAGLTQFSAALRLRYPWAHRLTGKIYVSIILFISGPTGLVMACYANGGPLAQVCFVLLALLWVLFTYKAYQTIRKGQVASHRNWMYRSYALTLSAVTLRLWKWAIISIFETRPMDTYRVVAWLGWVVNLGIAEWLIYRHSAKRNSSH